MALVKLNNNGVKNATAFGSITGLGDLVFISRSTASSSASLSITSGIDSTYKEYIFMFNNIHPSANSDFAFNMSVDVYDNWANPVEVQHEYGIKLIDKLIDGSYDAIVIAVDHTDFQSWGESTIRKLGKSNHVLYDLKYSLPKSASDLRL